MAYSNLCGIYFEFELPGGGGYKKDKWLPLISLSAHATICQNSSRLTLKQEFSNPENEAIDEAAYTFPIYEGAAIVEFACKIGDRTIQGVVRDKHTARKIYETAKEQGQRAALMIQNTADVWSTKISNIPAAAKVEVEITLVCELKHDAQVDGIRFVLPTNIAPRYGDEPEHLPSGISADSRGINMTVAVTMASPITSLQSPSHPIQVGMGTHTLNKSLSKEEFDVCKGFATLSQSDTALDKDFVILVVSGDIGKPEAIVETHSTVPNSKALFLSLVPKFQLPRIKPEIVFIADRSGSMEDNIGQLKNALKVFLKSLPVGVKFNICSFGDRHTFLWPKSMPYDQDNLDTALKHVETFAADYGGTEMFPPVEEALKNRYKDIETEIIVLTDGEIWNPQPLFDLVQKECECGDVRVFSVGIGANVSHSLLEGLARSGRGYAQIVGTKDKLDAKLVRMLKASLETHVKEYELSFPDSTPTTKHSEENFEMVEHAETDAKTKQTISLYDTADVGSKPRAAEGRFSHLPPFEPPSRLHTPYRIPPLYPFNRTNVYVLVTGSEAIPASVTLRGTTASGVSLELEVPVKDVGKGTTVHQLAAKKLLQELEEGGSYLHSGKFGVDPNDKGKFMDWIEREAVRVGTTFGVAGKWTSFVAVENVDEIEEQVQQQAESVYDVEVKECAPQIMRCAAPMTKMLCSAPEQYILRSCEVVSYSSASFGGPGRSASADPGIAPLSLECEDSEYEVSSPCYSPTSEKREEPESEVDADDDESETYALLGMQAFDGSFPSGSGDWTPELTAMFNVWIQQEHEDGVATLRALGQEDLEKVLASAVAIAIFEGELKDSKDVWEMVVEKADGWGVEKVGETAWEAVKRWVTQQVAMADDLKKKSFWMTKQK